MQKVDLAIPLPKTFQGRPVTNRAVHMQPSGQWGMFMDSPGEWTERLIDMHMSIVFCLTDSDSFAKQVGNTLLEAGLIPFFRFNPSNLPKPFTQMEATEELVDLCSQYNVPCIITWLNEPGNSREWQNGEVPPDWWEVWTANWRNAAKLITERGAICAIPDGPVFPQSPFPDLVDGLENEFADGWIAYNGHYYALNRPFDWPYDDAQKYGTPMTEQEYNESLDDFVDNPEWRDPPLDVLNAEREEHKNPNLTAIQDATCWMGWEQTEYWMMRDLGFLIPHFMGEGGVTPRARAGSGEDMELRYTLPTPNKVAERTLEMFQWNDLPNRPAKHNMFCLCPWLLACDFLGGSGWEDDAYFGGGAYWPYYGFEKPVVQKLKDNPPGNGDAVAHIESAQSYLTAALEALLG